MPEDTHRIVSDPQVMLGKPVIKGTRITVELPMSSNGRNCLSLRILKEGGFCMKKHLDHSWKMVLFALGLLMVLVASAPAVETTALSEEVTLSAAFRDPTRTTGTFDFTFELEEPPAAPVLGNYSTISPETPAVPEPSTLVLIGLGVIGLAFVKKTRSTRSPRT